MTPRFSLARYAVRAALTLALAATATAPCGAQAQVSQPTAWVQEYANTANPGGTVGTALNIAAGSNRLLVVAIASQATATTTQTVTVSWGGQTLTQAQGDGSQSAQQHTYLYYLNDAKIAAATNNSPLNVSVTGNNANYTWVYAAVFAGVNQSTPFTNTQSSTSLSTASQTEAWSTALSMNANDLPIEVILLQRSTTGTTARTVSTWAANWGGATGGSLPVSVSNNDGTWMPQMYVAHRAVPAATTSETASDTLISASSFWSKTGVSLQSAPAATLTLATGSDPTPSTWNAGTTLAVDQFTLQMSSSTATVSQVNVGLTGNTAVTQIQLYSGTTCGGTLLGTVASPGSTATFTGLSINAGTTLSTYTLCATAGTVSSATSFSANVTSVVQTGASSVTGTDSAPTFTVQPSGGGSGVSNGRVVFGNNSTTPRQSPYTGSTNTFATPSNAIAGATPSFMVDRAAPTRNEHVAAYVTTAGQLYVMRWNGTSWSNEWNVNVGGDGVNGRRFDIAYENTSGRALVVYSNNTSSTVAYRIWNGTSWTAAATTTLTFLQDIPAWIKLAARPGSNEIAMAVCDRGGTGTNSAYFTAKIWSGSAWGNEPTTQALSQRMYSSGFTQYLQYDDFDLAYEQTTGTAWLFFTDSTPQQYWARYNGGAWSGPTSFVTSRAAPLQMAAASDPGGNNVAMVFNRSGSASVYAAVCNGSSCGGVSTAGTNGATTSANQKQVEIAYLRVGTTSYPVVFWETSTAGTLGYNSATVSGTTLTFGTAGSTSFGSVALNWMDVASDPASAGLAMVTFSDANSDLWAKQLSFSGTPSFTWNDAFGGVALTTTLTNNTSQNFGFAYDLVASGPAMTIGTGTDPTGATLTVGTDSAIDQFTLSLSPSGLATVTQVTVAVTGAAAASALELRSGTSCTGTLLASVPSPTATTTFTGLNIGVTTTSATYTLCAVPGPVAVSTNLSANVSGVTQSGAGTVTDSDTANTFTVPPSTVSLATGGFDPAANTSLIQGTTGLLDSFTLQSSYGTATINPVTLTLTGNTLLSSVAIMDNAACSGGTTYGSQANPSASQAITVTGMTAGTTATTFYVCGTATATASGSVTALVGSFTVTSYATAGSDTSNTLVAGARTITMGNGADPAGTTLTVGVDAAIDQFTLSLSPSGLSTVTQVTVAVTGSGAASTLELRSGTSCTGTLLASVAAPTATTAFTGLNIGVTATSATYTLCAIPGAVATATILSANASGLTQTGASAVIDNDAANNFTVPASTVTLATGSFDPAANTSLIQGTTGLLDSFTLQSSYGTASIGTVTLTLTGNTLLSSVAIMDNAACSGGTTYGSQAGPAASQLITVAGMTAGMTATTFYVCGTATATASGSVKALVGSFAVTSPYATAGSDTSNTLVAGATNKTLAGTATAVASSSTCTAIAVTAPYTGDGNANNSLQYRTRTPSGTGTWSGYTAVTHGASPYSFNITGLTLGATYDVEVTYLDADGVLGTAVQTVTGITVGAACKTTAGALTGSAASCTLVNLSASYTGDSNNNNSISIARGNDGLVFGTPVCSTGPGGSNPRTCADSTVSASSSYYYRATFSDPEGVVGTTTKDSGLVAVGACAPSLAVTAGTMPPGANVAAGSSGVVVGQIMLTPANGTVTLSSISISSTGSVQPADVAQLALFDATGASSVFVGAGAWNSSTSHWDFTSLSYGVASTLTFNVVLSVSQGAVTGRTFIMNMNVPADVTVASPQTISNSGTLVGNTFPITAGTGGGSTNTSAPMVSIINPLNGGTVSGTFKVQIRVFNKVNNLGINGVTASSVKLSTNNGSSFSYTATANTNYDTIFNDPNWSTTVTARTYEVTLSGLAQGAYTLRAQAANAVPLTTTSEPVQIVAAAAGKGDGNLLVRDNAGRLCNDCHAVQTHSSEAVGTKYGAWGTTCRDCHAPHGTRNIYLIKEQITPPSVNGVQSTKNVAFVNKTGDSGKPGWNASASKPTPDASFVNTTDNSGPCQACHTRTANPANGAARWRNSGNADSHYAAPGTAACSGCHRHQTGFKGGNCTDCHATTQAITKGPLAGTRSRRAIVGEFSKTWSHKRSAGGTVTKYDCGVCHMEGDPTTGGTTSYHADGYVDLRDPDTGQPIHDVTPPAAGTSGGYTDAGTVTKYPEFSRDLGNATIEPFAAAIMINQCLHCHDGNGASAGYVVPGGTAGQPFATTISGTGYNGANGLTACATTNGCVVNVDASFVATNSTYHPIKGRQNNWYAKDLRMASPWDLGVTTRTGTVNLTSWGPLITCWDCHSANAATGVQKATVTAHGGQVTLRQDVWVTSTVNNGAVGAGNLCLVCHKVPTTGNNHGILGTTPTGQSAFSSGGSSTPGQKARDSCFYCHSSSIPKPARPLPAQDAHGFDAFAYPMGSDKMWPVGATETFKPYAFIRSVGSTGLWNTATGWNPASAPGFTGSSTCGTASYSGCSGQSGMNYGPGGTF